VSRQTIVAYDLPERVAAYDADMELMHPNRSKMVHIMSASLLNVSPGVRLLIAMSLAIGWSADNRSLKAACVQDKALKSDDEFDARFTGKTLRFDYFHTGTATEEHISVDELRLEEDWPGSRRHLADESGLGNYFFEVHDPADDRIVYSRGFDSIFGEWQTTAEASQVWRTFHESQRFPEPKSEMRLTLKRRDSKGEWQPLYSGNFLPKGADVNRAPVRPSGELWSVFENGEPSKKLDLLVLGDGYTAADKKKFHDDVSRLTGVLFDVEPFRTRKSDFNVWAIDVAANESGISDPRRGLWRDSPLGFRSNAFAIDRYALSMDNKAIRNVAGAAPYDFLAIITNIRKHAGGGIYQLWANAPADSPTAPYVFVHELGHSIAGLEDEYYNAEVAYQITDPVVEPWRPNVTALLNPDQLKWKDLVEAGTPIPTPWTESEADRLKYVGKTGAFEGAGYRAKGLYRSELDCIMFSQKRSAFCRVCARAVEQVIRAYSE
jgi:hypothetical protein